MSRSTLNASYMLLTGVLIVAVAAGVTVGRTAVQGILDKRQAITEAGQTLAEKELFLESIERRSSQLAQYETEEQQLKIMVPASSREADIVRLFSAAARDAGGVIISISDQSATAKRRAGEATPIIPLAYEIDYRGSYSQTRAFISKLETAPRPVDITNFSTSRNEEEPDLLTTHFKVQLYQLTATSL